MPVLPYQKYISSTSEGSDGVPNNSSWSWNFDIGSFMVLLGEQDELNYRLMDRRFVDLLSLAPVSGLQNYFRDRSIIVEAAGPNYISPKGGNEAPLRNMRTARLLSTKHLLDDGTVSIYRIRTQPAVVAVGQQTLAVRTKAFLSNFSQQAWAARTFLAFIVGIWLAVGGLLAFAFLRHGVTWVGKSNLIAFVGWSVILRIIDFFSLEPGKRDTTDPTERRSVIFMGRRQSAFILEGTREQIAEWTNSGLTLRKNAKWPVRLAKLGTVALLLFIFASIPNGTSDDQVLFVALNILGQAATWGGQRLYVRETLQRLEKRDIIPVSSRTHVYAILLRREAKAEFPEVPQTPETDGTSVATATQEADIDQTEDWVDAVGLLPKTKAWRLWKKRVVAERGIDAKVLYKQCLKATPQ